jgi:hypothetical protein
MEAGRARRVQRIAGDLGHLRAAQLELLSEVSKLLDSLD